MNKNRKIVVTTYGHNRIIDKIAVSIFEDTESYYRSESNADTYCRMINSLDLNGDYWVFAKVISGNTPYSPKSFLPAFFSDIISKLDPRALQVVLREVSSQVLAKAFINESDETKEKLFNNMSKRATQMLKEDMECLGIMQPKDIVKAQENIMDIIYKLEDCGQIVVNRIEE